MAEAVELCTDLTELSDHHLLIANTAIRLRQHIRALRQNAQLAAWKERHGGGIENLAQFNYLARANQFRRFEHLLRFHQVSRAALIASAPLRGTTLAFGRRNPGLPRRDTCDEQKWDQHCDHGPQHSTSCWKYQFLDRGPFAVVDERVLESAIPLHSSLQQSRPVQHDID